MALWLLIAPHATPVVDSWDLLPIHACVVERVLHAVQPGVAPTAEGQAGKASEGSPFALYERGTLDEPVLRMCQRSLGAEVADAKVGGGKGCAQATAVPVFPSPVFAKRN